MGTPVRFTFGITQAAKYQPLGSIGIPDPFFYASFDDDFLPFNSALYTETASGGTIAATAANGNGGRILFTTGAVANDFCELQLPSASFQIVTAPQKRLAFLTRVNLAALTDATLIAGLCETTVTPFSAITDGIYFIGAPGSANVTLNVVTGSTVIGSAVLSNVLVAGQDTDLGFYVNRDGNIYAFAGNSLEGAKDQNRASTVLGPNGGILYTSLTGVFTTALLNPTLAVSTNAAAAVTMVSDFLFAAMER